MKKIGLIGGMSWESSLMYYKIINAKIKELKGGHHSAKCIMESVDFAEIVAAMDINDWSIIENIVVNAAQNLEKSGAELVLLCTNSIHLCANAISNNINIPFIHIARATAKKIKESKVKKVLLLGTKFTMEQDFFKDILSNDYGIEVVVPNKEDKGLVHQVIFDELVKGQFLNASKKEYQRIVELAVSQGAQGVIWGCTEIPLLITEKDVSVPAFDTTRIHAEAAVELALSN